MNSIAQTLVVVRLELAYYLRNPKLVLAALAVSLIPAFYTVIYLTSVWDPAAHTSALPVALVNLDRDVRYRNQDFNLGREIIAKLKSERGFGYVDLTDADQARREVREGRLAFALIVPADFSSNALPGADPGAGRLEVYSSEGNSYQSANLARRFADELGLEVNDRLNERRWALVLDKAVGSEHSVERLRAAVGQLGAGARELAAGSDQAAGGAEAVAGGARRLKEGVGELGSGARELAAGLRTLESRQPHAADLQRLRGGAEGLVAGQAELGSGLAELQAGSARLTSGAQAFRDGVKSGVLLGSFVGEGADEFADGMNRLDAGLRGAASAQRRLAEGGAQLAEGVTTLTGGLQAQGSALRELVAALPGDGEVDELAGAAGRLAGGADSLAEGNRRLKDGARHLASGLDLLADELPESAGGVEGSAAGLAHSVKPEVAIAAPVQNNGAAYAPNLIAAALWLGAGIAAFLIHVRVMPREASGFSRSAQLLGKLAVPVGMVALQAALVWIAVAGVLGMVVVEPLAFGLTLGVASVTFLVIVVALTKAFGDAGKALAILFLAIQISSSGGILPVELSGGVFMELSPWLPLTWVVKAIKVTMFGAFEGAWQLPLFLVGAAGLLAFAFGGLVGKWRYVDPSEIRPAVEF